MNIQVLRLPTLLLLLSCGWGSASHADGLDCSHAVDDLEAAICAKSELSQLAALADALGSVVGLEVKYDAKSVNEDFGLSRGVGRLLSTLTLSEAHNLSGLSQRLPWNFVFDVEKKVLILNAEYTYLQDGLVVFDPTATSSSTPNYSEMETLYDAVRYSYRTVGNILEITSNARPAETTEKYRFQDGCWRLIGTDTVWAGNMVEFNDDLAAVSTNHLTGREVSDFKLEKGIVRTYDPFVQCLGDELSYGQIVYHDKEGQ
ncbi:hypothetical protein [Tritonibacter scottomollicae]|uniref:hypothetical protein n=1 Tax=Tritonibacter scottomollicae TaxID=483013 RepID=UPI003AA8A858